MKNKLLLICSLLALSSCIAFAGKLDKSQQKWYEKYKVQENAPDPADMLLNTDPEPDLTEGFVPLFNGINLTNWRVIEGNCKFEVKDGMIVGTNVPGSPSTYLCTDKDDYTDFIFTCDMKIEVDGNTGIMVRAKTKGTDEIVVYGPQVEVEDFARQRYWSGGIYGQSCGGWYYPLWLEDHAKIRTAMKENEWNRITVLAKGNTIKTWVNGIPAANWVDDTYKEGFFGLQVHVGKQGTILWKNLLVKELK